MKQFDIDFGSHLLGEAALQGEKMSVYKSILTASVCAAALIGHAGAEEFNISKGDLKSALSAYAVQTGTSLIYATRNVEGVRTDGVHGNLSPDDALARILKGTGFTTKRFPSGAIGIDREQQSLGEGDFVLAQATPARSAVETVTVTSSKLGGADVQSIPIAITALSQEQLTATQTAGGPDLVKQVPNLTFTKTNFAGYSIQIRGIGTQAISVTTDPAVAVAFNDVPFIRNHFFEQEFYDVGQVEVLRGPQGTLYGRNATAGVVNLTSAKPTDQFEAMASAELGNYHQRRFEGMLNLPIVDDRLDIRLAAEWTKRQGYSFNELTDSRIDGRDLWSGRLTIGFKPFSNLRTYLVWEHFSEDDDRLRSSKQLCHRDPTPTHIGSVPIGPPEGSAFDVAAYLSQGCRPASLYSAESFEVPNGFALPYYGPLANLGAPIQTGIDPYASTVQSRNLRQIESALDPTYKAKNDILEFNADYAITPALVLTSQTAFNHDFIWSTEDYNRFNTSPGIFVPGDGTPGELISPNGVFCDPQLGCSDRLVAEDLSNAHSWQASQELRLASHFGGPLNFSVGANYLHYETEENYYVFINSITMLAAEARGDMHFYGVPWVPGVTDNHRCLADLGNGFQYGDPTKGYSVEVCTYIDPNPIGHLNNEGHNYFLSQNPYLLNSFAGFGEVYYDLTKDLKLTGGLRWTRDEKHAPQIPSWLVAGESWGYPVASVVNQSWGKWTGRLAANWTPELTFTDQTLVYGSFAHGYKAGGANPPPPILVGATDPSPVVVQSSVHPFTFKPEFVDAFEIGTKNTLLDDSLTLNGNVFYYNYENYQISEIVDRTSINLNFDAHIKGAELEATWEPVPGLRFNVSGGYEDARLAKGSQAIDLMDRTAGHTDWFLAKPFPTNPSNCILPVWLFEAGVSLPQGQDGEGACIAAYKEHLDPITGLPYVPNPTVTSNGDSITGYPGFDPSSAPNNGEGFDKDLSHNQMPNAPPFTVSAGAQYSMPLSSDWAGTLRGDFYWQSNSYWRVFNDLDYDKLHGYTNLNLALIFTNQNGWQVMLYDKNVFNTTAITGAFLNSDDTGLTTNVFLTDPKLIGVRVTKNW